MKCAQPLIPAMTLILLLAVVATAQQGGATKVEGYVLDSSCAYTKNLAKPVSATCARSCAKAGSPLVILTSDGTIYWPISGGIPATSQNQRLLSFAGEKVTVSGKVFERRAKAKDPFAQFGGASTQTVLQVSHAIVIEKVERVASSKPAPAAR